MRRRLLQDEDVRLLTLTGPPGVGKTRLALELAVEASHVLTDGAAFVDLAAISDAALVVHAITQALGLPERPDSAPLTHLAARLRDRQALLILDNFEHVTEAAPSVAQLLGACPGVRILVTSRVPLHLSWEHEFPLAPLAIPDPRQASRFDLDTLRVVPAVALFIERARAASREFDLDHQNAAAVVDLCRRLDGLPLAIELAASQIKLFPVHELLSRLDQQSHLSDEQRDRPARHRALRSAIGWSYELLGSEEQALFRRLAIFVGGVSVDAAGDVCAGESPLPIRERLAALVDKSLLRQESEPDGRLRFYLLESLRAFGLEQLNASGEREDVAGRHASFFLGLAERAEPELHGHQQSVWLDQLEQEFGNLRAALGWSTSGSKPELGLRLASALLWFWDTRGHWTEGRHWLQAALDGAPQAPISTRAKAMSAAGHLAFHQDDHEQARTLLERSVELFRRTVDQRGLAEALDFLATEYRAQMDYVRAGALHAESLELFRRLGDAWGIAQSLTNLAFVENGRGNYARAAQLAAESLHLSRHLGRQREIALSLYLGGLAARHQGQMARAEQLFEESLDLFRALGAKMFIAYALYNLGILARTQRAYAQAVRLHEESLALLREIGDGGGVAAALAELGRVALRRRQHSQAFPLFQQSLQLQSSPGNADTAACLESLAAVEAMRGHPARAATWLAAADALRASIHTPIPAPDRGDYDRYLTLVRSRLGEEAFQEAWATGQRTPLREILDAVATLQPPRSLPAASGTSNLLTRREAEVAALVARGLSNREIAKRLFISQRTADTHLQHILGKLGASSRAQIAVWAVEQGLKT